MKVYTICTRPWAWSGNETKCRIDGDYKMQTKKLTKINSHSLRNTVISEKGLHCDAQHVILHWCWCLRFTNFIQKPCSTYISMILLNLSVWCLDFKKKKKKKEEEQLLGQGLHQGSIRQQWTTEKQTQNQKVCSSCSHVELVWDSIMWCNLIC